MSDEVRPFLKLQLLVLLHAIIWATYGMAICSQAIPLAVVMLAIGVPVQVSILFSKKGTNDS